MIKTVAVVGTFDTKYADYMFLAEAIREQGLKTLCVDMGTHQNEMPGIDIPNTKLAAVMGTTIDLVSAESRSKAVSLMAEGARRIVEELQREKKIHGIISMGGGGALDMATHIYSTLPIGFPKVFASTFGGNPMITRLTEESDTLVMNSLVDVSGINCITSRIYLELAGAIAGAVRLTRTNGLDDKKKLAVTMYGMTTPGVTAVKKELESMGYEVVTFHATVSGGNLMEKLIRDGIFDGVLDLTLPEINDLALKENTKVRPDRMEAAADMGIPCIICPGALDMAGYADAPPELLKGRVIYCHNDPNRPTHFRPAPQDSAKTGELIAKKLNRFKTDCALVLPHGGLSLVDLPGKPMYNPEADKVLFDTIKSGLVNSHVTVLETEGNMNDESTAHIIAEKMSLMMNEQQNREQKDESKE